MHEWRNASELYGAASAQRLHTFALRLEHLSVATVTADTLDGTGDDVEGAHSVVIVLMAGW